MFHFPRPGERCNQFTITISERDLAGLLGMAAHAITAGHCEAFRAGECETCNRMVTVWWDYCNALSCVVRIHLQSEMHRLLIDLPPSPWEDEEGTSKEGNNA